MDTQSDELPTDAVMVPKGIADLDDLFCGCLDPDKTWGEILKELRRVDKQLYDKDASLAAAICHHLALTEHGTSIRGGWLTEKGKAALSFLEQYGMEWKDNHTCSFFDEHETWRGGGC